MGGSFTSYWIASRDYRYDSATKYGWRGLTISWGYLEKSIYLYYYDSSSFREEDDYNDLRPIVTLKSGLKYSGVGTEEDPYTLSVS